MESGEVKEEGGGGWGEGNRKGGMEAGGEGTFLMRDMMLVQCRIWRRSSRCTVIAQMLSSSCLLSTCSQVQQLSPWSKRQAQAQAQAQAQGGSQGKKEGGRETETETEREGRK